MNNVYRVLLYVHDYGSWHIAEKGERVALCGFQPKPPLKYWKSQASFRRTGAQLEVDERAVCGICLFEVGKETNP